MTECKIWLGQKKLEEVMMSEYLQTDHYMYGNMEGEGESSERQTTNMCARLMKGCMGMGSKTGIIYNIWT